MVEAKGFIRKTLEDAQTFVRQNPQGKLSEADTKANFIEPIIRALGWGGLGVVTREYYVSNSQEFIDYVMFESDSPVLAIEAKPINTRLSDKHAAQLIQYCSVEGIEWAALTNGREIQFFNSFLTPNLDAKRIFKLDLISFGSDHEFDHLFDHLWLLSRESLSSDKGTRLWLNQHLLDGPLREMLLDPTSAVIRSLRRQLVSLGIRVNGQEVTGWFQRNLKGSTFHLIEKLPPEIDYERNKQKPGASKTQGGEQVSDDPNQVVRKRARYTVQVKDLLDSGYLQPDTEVILRSGPREVARANIADDGTILWNGTKYRSVSDKAFAPLIGPGRTTLNGWVHWFVGEGDSSRSLAEVRKSYLDEVSPTEGAT